MKCEELKTRVESGAPLDGAAWEHASSCAHCREEFAHLRALRTAIPEPPAGLRDRVLEAAYPATTSRRGFRWSIVASAAAVALAFAGGISIGRDVERSHAVAPEPKTVVVERIVEREVERAVETKKKPDDGDMFILALGLEKVYSTLVCVDYDGVTCSKIHASKEILDYIQYCPVARKLWVAANERPDVVEIDR